MGKQINTRQLEVLRWIADGCMPGRWPDQDYSYRTSAAALKSRGLVTIKGSGKTWFATITDLGTYYLQHGSYPPEAPKQPSISSHRAARGKLSLSDGAAETLEQAKGLIAELQESKSITIMDPEESTRSHYRRVLHACRIHRLVPDGHELRFTGRNAGDIVIMLGTGSPAETADWDRIRTTARKITTNLDAIRTALETSTVLSQVSESQRPRAIVILLDLANRLPEHGLRLGVNIKLKTPKLFIQVDTRKRDLIISEILKEVPHIATAAELRSLKRTPWMQIPESDQVHSGLLCLRVDRDGSHMEKSDRNDYSYYRKNRDEWADEKRKPLEDQVPAISRAIKQGVIDDDDAREREKQRRAEAHEAYERKQAEECRTWEAVRSRARTKAILELRESTFAQAFEAWQGAQELRAFAASLEEASASSGTVLESRPKIQEWLDWARKRADEMDPILNLALLDDSVFDQEPSIDDLRPHMEGWDPSAPHKDYGAPYRREEHPPVNMPKPLAWHPGMRGRPSWWRKS